MKIRSNLTTNLCRNLGNSKGFTYFFLPLYIHFLGLNKYIKIETYIKQLLKLIREKTTLEKGRTAPPDVSVKNILNSLSSDMKNHFKVEKCRQEIIKKYSIIIDKDGKWNLSDKQKAWGNIQRMSNSLTKTRWSLTVLAELRKRDEKLDQIRSKFICHVRQIQKV